MNKLLKTYHLSSDMQYFELIADSFLNGQFKQAIDQFRALPKAYKAKFLYSATIGNWQGHNISNSQLKACFDNL